MKPLYPIFTVLLALLAASCGWTNPEEKEPGFQEQKPKVDTIYYVDTVYIDSLIYPEAYYPEKCPEDIGCTPSVITLSKDFNGHFFYFKKWDTLRIEDGPVINYLGGWQDTVSEYLIKQSQNIEPNDSIVYICIDTVYLEREVLTNYALLKIEINGDTRIDTATFFTDLWIKYMHNDVYWANSSKCYCVEGYIDQWLYYINIDLQFAQKHMSALHKLPIVVNNREVYLFDIYAYWNTYHGGNDIIFYLK